LELSDKQKNRQTYYNIYEFSKDRENKNILKYRKRRDKYNNEKY